MGNPLLKANQTCMIDKYWHVQPGPNVNRGLPNILDKMFMLTFS